MTILALPFTSGNERTVAPAQQIMYRENLVERTIGALDKLRTQVAPSRAILKDWQIQGGGEDLDLPPPPQRIGAPLQSEFVRTRTGQIRSKISAGAAYVV